MTLIVGILCENGVVMASDSAATFGASGVQTIGQQNVQKVRSLAHAMLFSSTGAVGISQVIADSLEHGYSSGALKSQRSPEAAMDTIGKSIGQQLGPYLQTANLVRPLVGDASQSLCKSMLAMIVNKEPCLFTFDFNGAPERATPDLPFVAMGSGQQIADPFLAYLKRLLWSDSTPSLAEGRLVATWVLEHATRTNPGGVGGPTQLAELTLVSDRPNVEMYDADRVQEHSQNIQSAEDALVRAIRHEDGDESEPPEFKKKKASA